MGRPVEGDCCSLVQPGGTGAGATALAYAWYLKGVQQLGAGVAAAYMALVPLFGMLWSSLWLQEPVTRSLLEGGAASILGMLLMNAGRMRMGREVPATNV